MRLHNDFAPGVCKLMAETDEATLRQALRALVDPATGRDVVAAGLVDSLTLRGGLVHVALRTDRASAPTMEGVRARAETLLRAQPGVLNATAVLTAHRAAPPEPAPPAAAAGLLPDVRFIVAVASGKGGVGKSTTAVNLAVALARMGLRTGLLDADIYGPSLPIMLGLNRKPEVRGERMIPLEAWGLRAMSIGFLVDPETPMVWRGPMVMGALQQLLGQVEWGALDIMIVDMPPGTGDAQLTMAQKVKLAGAVIVSTPQDVALADARRGVRMFEKTSVPVLGLVENMSFYCCPACGHRAELFGHGGAAVEAARLGVPFLGEIPLLLDIRTLSDAGTPVAAAAPDSVAGLAYAALAERVWTAVQGPVAAAPRIVMD
jgi:ATP-binding protein involved in chromosome partitioning